MIERNCKQRVLIGPESAYERLKETDWVAVDCRFDLGDPEAGRRRYEAEHLPGAVYLDLDKDLAGPVTHSTGRHPLPCVDRITATIARLGIGNSSNLIVYDDHTGAIAARAWWIFRWLGHNQVHLLDGGFRRWCNLGLETSRRITQHPLAQFVAKPRPELVVTTAELEADIDGIRHLNLLDARSGVRFRGEDEPIDPVAGHVPGGRNLPFEEFLAPDGSWLPLKLREERLLTALGGERSADWSVMCGSGVTACHLAVTGIEAGLREPRVYVGSWSEWITDPGRPLGTSKEE
jgi:thiosulfate/3-mercaptopyruvate sulfurtransferase